MRRWIICLVAFVTTQAFADPDADMRRMKHEAAALFTALADDSDHDLLSQASACEFARTWLDYPVDADVARRHLHVKMSLPGARLAPPSAQDLPDYEQTVDVKGGHAQAFCDETQATNYFLKKWLGDEAGDKQAADRARAALMVSPTGYAFPLFNAEFDRALMVTFHATRGLSVDAPQSEFAAPNDGYSVLAFAKVKGEWTVETREALGVVSVARAPLPPRRPPDAKPKGGALTASLKRGE